MTKIAVIEDDLPMSNQLKGWIESARPGIQVDQWFNRDDAEAAVAREDYDAVVLDIELGRGSRASRLARARPAARLNHAARRAGWPGLA